MPNVFLTFPNKQHLNIKFTLEKEINKFVTSVYSKPTYTGLLTNYNSFRSPNYIKGLIKTIVGQSIRINSTWSGFHYDILNIMSVLEENELPLKLSDKSMNKYLSINFSKAKENKQMPLLEFLKKHFCKLTYICNFYIQTKNTL